jgi:DNA polymerase-3 subunit beta
MDVHGFLPIDQAEQKNSVDLNAAILRDIYHLTAFAVGDSTTRPEFSGVNISFKNGTLAATATNSHRLARKQIPFEAYPSDFIIPPTAMAVISRLIDTEEKVRLSWSPGKAWIEANNVYISSRLIDGRFPDADRVIPKTFATTVCVDRKQFLQAIERLALVGLQKIEKFTVFTLKLSIADGLLTLSSEAADKGQAKEELPTITTGEPMEICFSSGNHHHRRR